MELTKIVDPICESKCMLIEQRILHETLVYASTQQVAGLQHQLRVLLFNHQNMFYNINYSTWFINLDQYKMFV